MVARLANTLGSELVKAEAEKSSHSGNPDAIDLTMRGWAILNQPQSVADKDSLAKALDLFEQALKLDPNNVDALVGAAAANGPIFFSTQWTRSPDKSPRSKSCLLKQSGSIRRMPEHTWFGGRLYRVTKRNKEAVEAAQNRGRLSPNYALAYAQLAQDQNLRQRNIPLAIANIEHAIKLSPRDPEMGRWHEIKGKTLNYMGRYQDGIREKQAALDSGYLFLDRLLTFSRGIRFLGPAIGGPSCPCAGSQTKPQVDR